MTIPTHEDLAAIEAIRQLKARYCRFFDTGQWDRLAGLFTPDARLEGFTSVPDGSGPEAFIAAVSVRLSGAVSIHHVTAPEIVPDGPDRARGIWAMSDFVQLATDPDDRASEDRGWRGWGYYQEAYARHGGVWRIAFMRLVRSRLDPLPAGLPPPAPGRPPPASDWLASGPDRAG